MTKFYSLLALILFAFNLLAADITITDADLTGDNDYIWTSDNVYFLDGYVFLEAGGTLTINPGTVIKGIFDPSNGDNASALIITKGAQIIASGTASSPIIFTSELDDVNNNNELTSDNKGLWGGVIILGDGIVGVDGGSENIEGIPSTEGRASYGGDNNDDNSGVLQYVSIRHAGTALEANNEINGLTLGGVGSGTKIEYIEVFANKDDGIEWFGGAVNVKNAVVAFCGDDSFDFDQDWSGKGQFWFSLQDEESNRAGEWDGSEASDAGIADKAVFQLANATFIGAGADVVSENEDGNDALRIRDFAAAEIYNSIITEFSDRAIRLDGDVEGDTWDRFLEGDGLFRNNVFFGFGAGSSFDEISKLSDDALDKQPLLDQLVDEGNMIVNPTLGGISREPNGGLDPRIASWDLQTGAVELDGTFFEDVNYVGAFNATNNWALGWTALDAYGYFGNGVSNNQNSVLDINVLEVFPNPFETQIQIKYSIAKNAMVSLNIYSLNGQLINNSTINQSAGEFTEVINLESLEAGKYIITILENGTLTGVQQIIKK